MKIKHGTTRIVLLIAGFAIKMPTLVEWRLFLNGLLANMQERIFSKMDHVKLCPVIFSLPGGWLVVMKRAEPLPREQFLALDYDLWISDPEVVIPVENKLDSFGILDGKIVAVDYGS